MGTWVRRAWSAGWFNLLSGVGLVVFSVVALALGESDMPLWLHGAYFVTGLTWVIRGVSQLGWLAEEAAANHAPPATARERWGRAGVLLLVVLLSFVAGRTLG